MFGFTRLIVFGAVIGLFGGPSYAQPNPYRLVENWAQLPPGLVLGQVMGVEPGPDGNLYVFQRCSSNTCVDRTEPPILKFDASGKFLKSWGEGMFVWPHGFHVDRNGFVWATDARGGGGKGHQVFKFSPDGKILMTLGKAGVAGSGPDTFNAPADVAVGPNGDIFVADGHDTNARVMKFSRDGKFIKAWGKPGTGAGEFAGLHAIALDSRGRLFVGDRGNSRIQIFDQEGKFLAEWKQFGPPSGIFISKDDTIYVADNGVVVSVPTKEQNPGGKGGIKIGSAKDGSLTALIPNTASVMGPEGVGVDAAGNVYSGEVGLQTSRKYVKR